MKTLIINAPEKVAHQIQKEIGPLYSQAQSMCAQANEIQVSDEQDANGMKLARESRLALRKLRVDAVNKCKDLKADALATGKAIDETRRMVEDLFKPTEEHLMLQETFAERAQKERVEARRREREQLIVDSGGNPWDHNGFADMADSVFGALIEGIKHEVSRRKAEAEENKRRIKEMEERDRIERKRLAEENARLRAEAIEREKLAAIKRTKDQAEQRERERIAEKRRAAQQAIIDEERRKREALEDQQRKEQARIQAEAKVKEDEERARRNAPIKDKLEALMKTNAELEALLSQLQAAHRRALSEAVRSWNYEINQIIKHLQ